MDILLQNARVLVSERPFRFQRADVWVQDGRIRQVGPGLSAPGAEKVDCSSKIVLPGLVNAHTHAAMSLLRGVGDDLPLDAWLSRAIWPREARMGPEDVRLGAQLAMLEMIRSGTTCFNDMYFHMGPVAEAVEAAGLRATLGYGMIDLAGLEGGVPRFDFEGKGARELDEARRFAKGWAGRAGGRIQVSVAPHSPYTASPGLLKASAELASELRCPLHIHLAETRRELAQVMGLSGRRPCDHADHCGVLGPSTVAAHGVYATKGEVSLMARRGASVAHCPVSNLKLAGGGAAPVPEYLAAGVNVALGTDGAASNNSLGLFESMKVGAIEQKNFRFDASAVAADDYLAMATEGGARALGLKAGRIAPGYLADLALLDAAAPNLVPFSDNAGWLVYAAGPQNVSDVMVAGAWVMRERRILTLDEGRILARAQAVAERLAQA